MTITREMTKEQAVVGYHNDVKNAFKEIKAKAKAEWKKDGLLPYPFLEELIIDMENNIFKDFDVLNDLGFEISEDDFYEETERNVDESNIVTIETAGEYLEYLKENYRNEINLTEKKYLRSSIKNSENVFNKIDFECRTLGLQIFYVFINETQVQELENISLNEFLGNMSYWKSVLLNLAY